MNIKKHFKQMKLERRVHAVYNLYVVLEYSKVIYSGWNLFNDYLRFGSGDWS